MENFNDYDYTDDFDLTPEFDDDDVFAAPSISIDQERAKYIEMLDDCLVVWRSYEVARALDLGIIDAKTALELPVYDLELGDDDSDDFGGFDNDDDDDDDDSDDDGPNVPDDAPRVSLERDETAPRRAVVFTTAL